MTAFGATPSLLAISLMESPSTRRHTLLLYIRQAVKHLLQFPSALIRYKDAFRRFPIRILRTLKLHRIQRIAVLPMLLQSTVTFRLGTYEYHPYTAPSPRFKKCLPYRIFSYNCFFMRKRRNYTPVHKIDSIQIKQEKLPSKK